MWRKSFLVLSLLLVTCFAAVSYAEDAAVEQAGEQVEAAARAVEKEAVNWQDPSSAMDEIVRLLSQYGLRILGALAVFIIGRIIAKWLSGLVSKALAKTTVEPTLIKFVKNLVYTALLVFVIIAALGVMGIETASFAVVLGAAGLAVGLALQGSLSNFAGGILILFFKPFKAGDVIDAQGYVGTVDEIQIFNTIIRTLDNQQYLHNLGHQ